MDIDKLKSEAKVGDIKEEYISYLKHLFITEILDTKNERATTALMAYAYFLNKSGINSDNYPLYLTILESNNRYAIDLLIEGYEPEKYLDCVIPNHFIVENVFKIFSIYKRNEVYEMTLRVLFGLLIKVYISPQEGYQLYKPTIPNVNDLGKILDESKDQDDELNRDILDILMYLADLDTHYTDDPAKKEIARQAGRIRSDFFDHMRSLEKSITEVILEKAEVVNMGTPPDYVYK